jgi:hypothetical protein
VGNLTSNKRNLSIALVSLGALIALAIVLFGGSGASAEGTGVAAVTVAKSAAVEPPASLKPYPMKKPVKKAAKHAAVSTPAATSAPNVSTPAPASPAPSHSSPAPAKKDPYEKPQVLH